MAGRRSPGLEGGFHGPPIGAPVFFPFVRKNNSISLSHGNTQKED
ncbi:MAG: hypothetical protein V3U37_02925 [Nitrospinaceae bacterium]